MPFANTCAFLTAAALAIFAASGKDRQISSYAMENTPVYGSSERAKRASDVLQYLSVGAAVAVYAIKYYPSADEPFSYTQNIVYNHQTYIDIGAITMDQSSRQHLAAFDALAAGAVSCALASATTEILKRNAARPRPDASDYLSFPSGHSTTAAWANRWSALMIREYDLPPQYAYPAYGTLTLLTLGTAWGRVEGGRHYPSDVFAGMLVGVAMANASFAVFEKGGADSGTRFEIRFTNDGQAATGLALTVEF